MRGKKVTTGPKPVRSDNVTMRFDSRLKYLASVVARYERRSFSNIVELALERYLNEFAATKLSSTEHSFNLTKELWSPHQVLRFALLADELPTLLTFEEEVLWRLILKDGALWKAPPPLGVRHKLNLEQLQEKWSGLVAEAEQIAAKEANINLGNA